MENNTPVNEKDKEYYVVSTCDEYGKGYLFKNSKDFKRFVHAKNILTTYDCPWDPSRIHNYMEEEEEYDYELIVNILPDGSNYPLYDEMFGKVDKPISFVSLETPKERHYFISQFTDSNDIYNTDIKYISKIFVLGIKEGYKDKVCITINNQPILKSYPKIVLFREYTPEYFNRNFANLTKMDIVDKCESVCKSMYDDYKDIISKHIKKLEDDVTKINDIVNNFWKDLENKNK